ncbi:MAG: methionine adenosyltransferase domain-containing protein [Anaeromassilibacillus sp.]
MDSHGGYGRHGAALLRKGPDQSGPFRAYAARYVAKNIVAAGLAKKWRQLAYAIGVARPISVAVDTFGTSIIPANRENAVRKVFDLRPAAIIQNFDLCRRDLPPDLQLWPYGPRRSEPAVGTAGQGRSAQGGAQRLIVRS